jgi:flagellar assembly factor FliW
MKANTIRFGELDINPETILTFPRGLLGLENCTRFKLLHNVEKDAPVVFFMQSLDDPAVTFSVVNPAQFGINYEFLLSDEETDLLQSVEPNDLAVALMVYKPMGANAAKDEAGGGISANINGPLVLNLGKKLGLQKVLVGPQFDITLRDQGS